MKIYLGKIIESAFRITKENKNLWVWQMLPALAFIFAIPTLLILYFNFRNLLQKPDLQIPIEPWMKLVFDSTWVLVGISFFLLWVISQIVTIYGVVDASKKLEKIYFSPNFLKSAESFWRVFCVYIIFGGTLVMFIYVLQLITLPILGNSPDLAVYFIPFSVFFLAILIIIICIIQLAQAAIAIDNLNILSAISYSLKLLRTHSWNLLPLTIAFYVGLPTLFGFSLFPFLFLAFMAFLFLTRLPDPNVILSIAFFVGIPLFIIVPTLVLGILMTFFQSTWAILYLQISSSLKKPSSREEPA